MNKLLVELSPELGRRAKTAARSHGVSMQALVETAIAEKLAAIHTSRRLRRGSKASRERALELLARAPDVPPVKGDELPPELAAKLERLKAKIRRGGSSGDSN